MIEDLHISVPLSEVPEAQGAILHPLRRCPASSDNPKSPTTRFYFLCSRECDIVRICESLRLVHRVEGRFQHRLSIGIGLADKESIDGEVYRVQDEATLSLWRDILRFTFDSDFVRRFFPYNTVSRARCASTAHCASSTIITPTRCKGIAVEDRKTSNLVFRFQGRTQAALVAKIFSLCIARMPFYKGKGGQCRTYPHRRLPVSATPPVSPGFAASFRVA